MVSVKPHRHMKHFSNPHHHDRTPYVAARVYALLLELQHRRYESGQKSYGSLAATHAVLELQSGLATIASMTTRNGYQQKLIGTSTAGSLMTRPTSLWGPPPASPLPASIHYSRVKTFQLSHSQSIVISIRVLTINVSSLLDSLKISL
jgi:hypothetical protein